MASLAKFKNLKNLQDLTIGRIIYPKDGLIASRVEREIWRLIEDSDVADGAVEGDDATANGNTDGAEARARELLKQSEALIEQAKQVAERAAALARLAAELAKEVAEEKR